MQSKFIQNPAKIQSKCSQNAEGKAQFCIGELRLKILHAQIFSKSILF